MARGEAQSLRQKIADVSSERSFWGCDAHVRLRDLVRGTSLGGRLAELTGRSVLVATSGQLTTALALIELDGRAGRLTVLPPDIDPSHFGALLAAAEIDAVVVDRDVRPHGALNLPVRVECTPEVIPIEQMPSAFLRTEWVLLTSGTTGVPKMVSHNLVSLTAAIKARVGNDPLVWGTFYDIRRYGGLQIFLRAVIGGGSFVLSDTGEPVSDHLARLARHGVTHLSGTPSHWRRALMSPVIQRISPRYVRLSGEIADQTILDSLRAVFPQAGIGHAYASTEAGVAFEVNDGLAGFPAAFVDDAHDDVEMKVEDGSLRIRSRRMASGYVGTDVVSLAKDDGFVDTGDEVERHGDRYFFVGRRGGIINIGGLKVHPEEVEAVINQHPQVRMSLARPKKSPITGSVVIADVVLKSECARGDAEITVKNDILALCRDALPLHKVPVTISFVPTLAVAATGKLARRHG